jgi:protein TonB
MVESKKNPKADLTKTTGLFFNVGLVITLLVVIVAFEWRVYEDGSEVSLKAQAEQFEDLMDIPQTQQPPPPPPKKIQPEIIEVPDEEEIEEEIEIDLDVEMTEETVIEEVVFEEAPAEEEVEDNFYNCGGSASTGGWHGSFLPVRTKADEVSCASQKDGY